jgi:hypothetical protein
MLTVRGAVEGRSEDGASAWKAHWRSGGLDFYARTDHSLSSRKPSKREDERPAQRSPHCGRWSQRAKVVMGDAELWDSGRHFVVLDVTFAFHWHFGRGPSETPARFDTSTPPTQGGPSKSRCNFPVAINYPSVARRPKDALPRKVCDLPFRGPPYRFRDGDRGGQLMRSLCRDEAVLVGRAGGAP